MAPEKLPVLATEAATTVGWVPPPSVEYSSFTLGTVPEVVQLIAWVLPTVQVSPPFGATRTRPPRILKFASETSFASASTALETRTLDRKSTRLNSSHLVISYAVFCLKKKKERSAATRCESSLGVMKN